MTKQETYNPHHGRIGAFVKDSESLSFAESAQDNCDSSCRLWSDCYASRIERIYKGLKNKLAHHFAQGPLWTVRAALHSMSDKPIRWARLSVDGSLPARGVVSARQWRLWVAGLREWVSRVKDRGASVHIPVETIGKARTYRAALRGLGVVVRRSVQSESIDDVIEQKDHRAWVAFRNGIHSGCITSAEKLDNIAYARDCAVQARVEGVSTVVCPKVASSSLCGECRACSSDLVDLVIYPGHA